VPQQKQRIKRRRKPQKPGKTAKMNDRHFVQHDYHDHANDRDEEVESEEEHHHRRGGVAVAFPLKLHAVLDQVEVDGLSHVISWQPHGRCFVIHDPKEFVDHVMPNYFRQSKLTSFQRQLNLYGFSRLTRGADAGGYYHELFLRGKSFLCKRMMRTKVKGTKFKAASSPDQEPDFYKMKPITHVPHVSSDEESHDSSHRSYEQQINQSVVQPVTSSCSPMDPFPVQYASVPNQLRAAPITIPSTFASYVSAPVSSTSIAYSPISQVPQQKEADNILDEAVDELFLDEGLGDLDLADFVHDWGESGKADSAQDDATLGVMLEKLLAEE
jgi:hypothetical protein